MQGGAGIRRVRATWAVCLVALVFGMPLFAGSAQGEEPGLDWTIRSSAGDRNWSSVAFGNGTYVAVAAASPESDRVMTSPDGVTWTMRTAAVGNNWNSVTFGEGLFVAVSSSGTGNRVMTSPDGINWTSRTSAADTEWYSVTYGEGMFVAVAGGGSGNRVMTSPDGINWTARDAAAANPWRSVTYGDGQFVAVATSGTGQVMTSPDGITWTLRSAAIARSWISVTYGGGLFVAVELSTSDNRVMTSPDGITWTARTAAASNQWRSVTHGNGLFVAVSASGTGNRVMTSPDGITWTARASAANNNWTAVAYAHGRFVAVSQTGTGNRVMTSGEFRQPLAVSVVGDGAGHVTSIPEGVDCAATCEELLEDGSEVELIATADSGSVFTGFSGACSGKGQCLLTMDQARAVSAHFEPVGASPGLTWDSRVSAVDSNWNSVAYGNGTYVAVATIGSSGDRVMTSPDGVNWTSRQAAAAHDWNSVTYGEGLFVAVASSGTGNRVMTSPDGIHWTLRGSAADSGWGSVTYGDGRFVAVASSGSGSRVMTSPDGIEWTERSAAESNDWQSVTYGGGQFVAVSGFGAQKVMTSPDGVTWTARSAPSGDDVWTSVTYGGGTFVAVSFIGSGNRVMTSPDGTNWTAAESGVENSWASVAHGSGRFVAVAMSGNGNRVMTSPDGTNWTPRASAADNMWKSVVFGGNQFVSVAGAGSGDKVMSSGLPRRALAVTRSGEGTGQVTSTPGGIDCGSACEAYFDGGTEVELTATPDAGSVFAGWSGDCSGDGPCSVTLDAVRNVGATFEPEPPATYELSVSRSGQGSGAVVSAPAGIDCGIDCAEIFEEGTEVTLTATPEEGSDFGGWTGDCSGTGPCVVTMDQARSVGANFEPEPPTLFELGVSLDGTGSGLVTSDPAGIDCGPDCAALFEEGTQVVLTAAPDDESLFAGWSGACSGLDPCEITVDQAKAVTATFNEKDPVPPPPVFNELVVSLGGTGSGSVNSDPEGIDCGEDCASAFHEDTEVTLTALPETGSTFAGWSGACSGVGTCVITMDQARNVGADFSLVPPEPKLFELKVSMGGTGSGTVRSVPHGIECGQSCAQSFEDGAAVTLTPTPAPGSSFAAWSGACSGSGACEVKMDQARSVEAQFELIPPVVEPARFTRIKLAASRKKVRAGKKLRLTIRLTNSGGEAGVAMVRIASSRRKAISPRTIRLSVPAGKTVQKTVTIKTRRGNNGPVKLTARLGELKSRSKVRLIR